MSRDPRYDPLFEPIAIGPLVARNRFFQVPHCNGMGHRLPHAVAAMRGVKAEGGWAVVATEECEIHPSSDVSPYAEARLWDDGDARRLALTAEAIKRHGSLAAIEITHNGHAAPNRMSRLPVMAVSDLPAQNYDPVQAHAMSREDIAALRRWHRRAALRARDAGFDIVYVYAAHDLGLPFHFLSRRYNRRSDEYGGSLENRARLLRELLEDTREAVGDTCAVALRFAVDELRGAHGLLAEAEGRDVVEMLAELPDLWDVNVSDWANDSVTARFGEEGAQEPYVAFVKQLTSKPVVGVGRFTSPDAMLAQLRRGVLDMIGAARPSIADPFLPHKIEQGRIEDIRECIGCNICVAGDNTMTPIRCTQNPTMGEEHRRGWHPERIPPAPAPERCLVVGAGPAGLEAALALAQRGFAVTLADERREPGGRVALESRLPGLASYARVRDYRLGQLRGLANVELFAESRLDAAQVLEFDARHVAVATGARWRRDGIGRRHWQALPGADDCAIFTPDDLMAARLPPGPVVLYDDDHYYLGGVLAELLVNAGLAVTLITPAPDVSHWTHNTLEQHRIEKRVRELGVRVLAQHEIAHLGREAVRAACVFTGEAQEVEAAAVVLVTSREPDAALYHELQAAGIPGTTTLARIGDCLAPGTVAAAVYAGHRYARELGAAPDPDGVPFAREYVDIG